MKNVRLLLLVLFITAVACSTTDDRVATSVAQTREQEVAVAEAVAATQTASVTDTPDPTVTFTNTPLPTPTNTPSPTSTAIPTETPTSTPRPTSTPDLQGSWGDFQRRYNTVYDGECKILVDDPDVFLHVPANLNSATEWCLVIVFLSRADNSLTAVYDSDFNVPGNSTYIGAVSIFQSTEVDDQLFDLVSATLTNEPTDEFTNYSLRFAGFGDFVCGTSVCTTVLEPFELDPVLPVVCISVTIADPVHLAVVCYSTDTLS